MNLFSIEFLDYIFNGWLLLAVLLAIGFVVFIWLIFCTGLIFTPVWLPIGIYHRKKIYAYYRRIKN